MTGNFAFDDDQTDFRTATRRFARSEFADTYHDRARSDTFPRDALDKVANAGYLGLLVSESMGGQGADLLSLGIACEEFAWADFNLSYLVFATALSGRLYERHLSPCIRSEWVQGMVSGTHLTSLAVTEPQSGSDARSMSAKATRVEDGWSLSGEKTSISMSPFADAAVVLAATDRSQKDATAFFVRLDDNSVSRQRFNDPGFRPIGRGALTFEQTFIPDSYVLGKAGDGFSIVMQEFDVARVLLGLMAIGAATRAIDMTVDFVRQRQAFGGPIARFQGVSFPIAEYATRIEAARMLCYHALSLAESGREHTKHAAMVKGWVPQLATRCVHECILLHGHVGWSEEMPLQQLARDVSALEFADGTAQIQKMIVAREVIGRESLPYSR